MLGLRVRPRAVRRRRRRGSSSRSRRSAACRRRSRPSPPRASVALPRALPGARPAGSPRAGRRRRASRAPARRRRRVDARRMAARLAVHRLPLARARLRAAAAASAARRATRRVGGVFLRVARGGARRGARWRCAVDALARGAPRARRRVLAGDRVALGAGGAALARIEWTRPPARRSRCRCCRATSTQDAQVRPATFARRTLRRSTPRSSTRAAGALVVLPESAFPVFADEVPEPVLQRCSRTSRARATATCCVGLFTAEPPLRRAATSRAYYNSVVSARRRRRRSSTASATSCRSARRFRSKPVVGWFIRRCSRSRSPTRRRAPPTSRRSRSPASASRSTSATRTCSATSSIAGARDATLLVNVTNDAWYGRSLAARAAQPDRRDARARDRPADAARDQHRHHVGDRPRRPRSSRGCRGSRAASSRSRSRAARARRRTCASAMRSPLALAALRSLAAAVARRGARRAPRRRRRAARSR